MAIKRRQERRGTSAEWSAENPVLALGEWGIDTDLGKAALGDGVTPWNDLLFYGDSDRSWYGVGDSFGLAVSGIRVRRTGDLVSLAVVVAGDSGSYNDVLGALEGAQMPDGILPALGTVAVIAVVADDCSNLGDLVYQNDPDGLGVGFKASGIDVGASGTNAAYLYGQVTYPTDDDPVDLSGIGDLLGGGTGGHHGGR